MPIEPVRERDPITLDERGRGLDTTPAWKEFFLSIFYALFGWKRSLTGTAALDFPNIAAGGEAALAITVKGARVGDAVIVTPAAKTAGIIDNYGLVTANDTVSVYAHNITAGAINPPAKNYRAICLQQ